MCCGTLRCALLAILAFFLPPLAVLIDRGCGEDLCFNIIFTLLGWIPGIIHAWYVLCKSEEQVLAESV